MDTHVNVKNSIDLQLCGVNFTYGFFALSIKFVEDNKNNKYCSNTRHSLKFLLETS